MLIRLQGDLGPVYVHPPSGLILEPVDTSEGGGTIVSLGMASAIVSRGVDLVAAQFDAYFRGAHATFPALDLPAPGDDPGPDPIPGPGSGGGEVPPGPGNDPGTSDPVDPGPSPSPDEPGGEGEGGTPSDPSPPNPPEQPDAAGDDVPAPVPQPPAPVPDPTPADPDPTPDPSGKLIAFADPATLPIGKAPVGIKIHGQGGAAVVPNPLSNYHEAHVAPGAIVEFSAPAGHELYVSMSDNLKNRRGGVNDFASPQYRKSSPFQIAPSVRRGDPPARYFAWLVDPSKVGNKRFHVHGGRTLVLHGADPSVDTVRLPDVWKPFTHPNQPFDQGWRTLAMARAENDPAFRGAVAKIADAGQSTAGHWRGHHRTHRGTVFSDVSLVTDATFDLDLFGDVLLFWLDRDGANVPTWDRSKEPDFVRVVREKFTDHSLRTRPFALGSNFDLENPSKRTWMNTGYRWAPQALDLALGLALAIGTGARDVLVSPAAEERLLGDLRFYCEGFVGPWVTHQPDARMWEWCNVAVAESIRLLFPYLGITDRSAVLASPSFIADPLGDATANNPGGNPHAAPAWSDYGPYTAWSMCGKVIEWTAGVHRLVGAPLPAKVQEARRLLCGKDGAELVALKTNSSRGPTCAQLVSPMSAHAWVPVGHDVDSMIRRGRAGSFLCDWSHR